MNKIIKIIKDRKILFLPYSFISLFLIIIPIFFLLFKTFSKADPSFDNWVYLKQASTWTTMGRSIFVGFLTSFFTILMALPFSYFVAKQSNIKLKYAYMSLAISPLFVFTISKILALRGIMTSMFTEESLNSVMTLVLGMTYIYFPFAVITLFSVLNNMPKSLEEASSDLGDDSFRTMIKVVIPYALKAIFISFALVFILASTSIIVSDKLVANNKSLQMIGNIMDDTSIRNNATTASSISALAFVTILIMMFIYSLIYLVPKIFYKIWGGESSE